MSLSARPRICKAGELTLPQGQGPPDRISRGGSDRQQIPGQAPAWATGQPATYRQSAPRRLISSRSACCRRRVAALASARLRLSDLSMGGLLGESGEGLRPVLARVCARHPWESTQLAFCTHIAAWVLRTGAGISKPGLRLRPHGGGMRGRGSAGYLGLVSLVPL